jgi:predicted SprT family Zn-dependent metalloprotease
MEITWSNDLTKTAGLCSSKTNLATKERYCSIRLSSKVLDTADRLRDTLIHEMCHAAAWIITGICDGHGRIFKDWGYTAKKRFPELPIITRCHTYVIRAKFTYKCVGCDNRVNRHSKSIDIEKKVCARCRGRFELVRNYRNSKGLLEPVEEGSSTAAKTPKKPNEFALFVKEKYKDVRTPGVKHGDAMKQLSKMFKGTKIFEDL